MNSLGEYFDKARSRRRAYSDEQIRELLDAASTGTGTSTKRWEPYSFTHVKPTRRTMLIIGIIGLAATLGTAVHLHEPAPGGPSVVAPATVAYQVRPLSPAPLKAPPVAAPAPTPARKTTGSGAAGTNPIRLKVGGEDSSDGELVVREEPSRRPDLGGEKFLGSRLIELEAGDLARLGIRVDSLGTVVSWREDGHDFTYRFRIDGMEMPDSVEGVRAGAACPSIVTDDVGGMRALIFDDDPMDSALDAMIKSGDPELVQKAGPEIAERSRRQRDAAMKKMENPGRLVPILVRTSRPFTLEDSVVAHHHRPDCIFWYDPTPELLAALPEAVRREVELELELAGHLVERSVEATSPEESNVSREVRVPMVVPGAAPYVDLIRSASGAVVSSAIMPNPAHVRATLTYTVNRSRAVSIALHDITGRLVRTIAPKQLRDAGVFDTTIDLDGLAGGVYLVVISTDSGEQAVQRLIVNR